MTWEQELKMIPARLLFLTVSLALAAMPARAVTNVAVSALPSASTIAEHDALTLYQWTGSNYAARQLSGTNFQAALTNAALGAAKNATNSLPAEALSGTLPDAVFPATLPAVSGALLTGLPGGSGENLLTNYVLVSASGNDATAALNSINLPAATITNALALLAADAQTLTNGVVFIRPGDTINQPAADGTFAAGQRVTAIAFGATLEQTNSNPFFSVTRPNQSLKILGGRWNATHVLGSNFKIGLAASNSVFSAEQLVSYAAHDWLFRANGSGLTNACTILVSDCDITLGDADFIAMTQSGDGTNAIYTVKDSTIHNYSPNYAAMKVTQGQQVTLQNSFFECYSNVAALAVVTVGGAGARLTVANCSGRNLNNATNHLIHATGAAVVSLLSPFGLHSQIYSDGVAVVTNLYNFSFTGGPLDGTNVWTGANTFAGSLIATNAALSIAGRPRNGQTKFLVETNDYYVSNGKGAVIYQPDVDPHEFLFVGGIQADQFTGGGSGLTNLAPASIAAGTIGSAITFTTLPDSPTNQWSNGAVTLGTVYATTLGDVTAGITDVLNAPTSTKRYCELAILTTGTTGPTFTNIPAIHCSDQLTSRVLTNGFMWEMSLDVIPGIRTNLAIVKF